MSDLVIYEKMVYAIAECERIDEAKELQNKATALAEYYKQAGNTDAERKVCAIRIRAESRVGELLKELARVPPQQAAIKSSPAAGGDSPSPYAKALTENNISSQQASRYQALAEVPRDVFEAALADPTAKPSSRALVEQAKAAQHKMPADALWLWGRLRDLERDGYFSKDADALLEPMTDTMRADVVRLAPLAAEFFNRICEECYESA
jgi:hypothetical protein